MAGKHVFAMTLCGTMQGCTLQNTSSTAKAVPLPLEGKALRDVASPSPREKPADYATNIQSTSGSPATVLRLVRAAVSKGRALLLASFDYFSFKQRKVMRRRRDRKTSFCHDALRNDAGLHPAKHLIHR